MGGERIAFLGWSSGGRVALESAVTCPERLALVSTSPGGTAASLRLDSLADLPLQERDMRSLQRMDQRWTADWLASHPHEARLARKLAGGEQRGWSESQQRGRQVQLQARSQHDVLDRLECITCPPFIGCDRHDGIAPSANGEAIAHRIPQASFHVYDGRHALFEQDATAWPQLHLIAAPGFGPIRVGRPPVLCSIRVHPSGRSGTAAGPVAGA